jgi:hypothetical protein
MHRKYPDLRKTRSTSSDSNSRCNRKKYGCRFSRRIQLNIIKCSNALLKCVMNAFVLNYVLQHKDVLGEWSYTSTHTLTSALDGGERSASRPGRLTSRERATGTH